MRQRAKVLGILIDNKGKTIGARLQYEGISKFYDVYTSHLIKHKNDIELENAIIDSNGFVKSRRGYPDLAKIEHKIENIITLYHGSKTGIKGKIRSDKSRGSCDFGLGFYTGTVRSQAVNLVCTNLNPKLYEYELNKDDVTIYTFSSEIEWALFVGINRNKIDIKEYSKLKTWYKKICSYDVISGYIADDKMVEVFQEFVDGVITDKVLIEALKLVRYGIQYVFKNDAACDKLKKIKTVNLTTKQKREAEDWGKKMRSDLSSRVNAIKNKYRREGRFIDEILKEYR